jgi:hypothetical protein
MELANEKEDSDAYDGFMSSGDSSDSDTDSTEQQCSQCACNFPANAKGCSVLRKLCKECHDTLKETSLQEGSIIDEDNAPAVQDENIVDEDNSQPVVLDSSRIEERDNGEHSCEEDKINSNVPIPAADDEFAGDVMTTWPAEVMRAFTSKEVSFELEICSIPQCFVWKKFSMDSPNAQVKLYIDLEIIDKAPLLYDYLLLSAHFNKSTQQLVLASSIIVHKSSGEIFLF